MSVMFVLLCDEVVVELSSADWELRFGGEGGRVVIGWCKGANAVSRQGESTQKRPEREREKKRKVRAAGEVKVDSTHYQPLHTHTLKQRLLSLVTLLYNFAFCMLLTG